MATPPGAKAAVRVEGLDKFLDLLGGAGASAMTPFTGTGNAVSAALKVFRSELAKTFNTEGASSGGRWEPLAPNTIRYRKPGPILQQTGRLRSSLVEASQDNLISVADRSLTLGSQVPYAQYHQKGTSRMPARPLIRNNKLLANQLAKAVFVSFQKRIGA